MCNLVSKKIKLIHIIFKKFLHLTHIFIFKIAPLSVMQILEKKRKKRCCFIEIIVNNIIIKNKKKTKGIIVTLHHYNS